VNSMLQYKSEPDFMIESDLIWCVGGTGTGFGELPAAVHLHQDRARPRGRILFGLVCRQDGDRFWELPAEVQDRARPCGRI
jgi:hypothetical protein